MLFAFLNVTLRTELKNCKLTKTVDNGFVIERKNYGRWIKIFVQFFDFLKFKMNLLQNDMRQVEDKLFYYLTRWIWL